MPTYLNLYSAFEYIYLLALILLFTSNERKAIYSCCIAVCTHLGFDYKYSDYKYSDYNYSLTLPPVVIECSKDNKFVRNTNGYVIQQLLMQCGDVESNPGPGTYV